MLPSPEDRLYLSAWHRRLVANELVISLVDTAADFGASHALVRDRIVWAPPAAILFIRGPLNARTVLASLWGGDLSLQLSHVLVTVSSACCFLSWTPEDVFFRLLSPTSSQWSPVDIARMNSLAMPHSLGLGLGGSRASASKLTQFCPSATLFRVYLPVCPVLWLGPEEAICILVSWKCGLLATRVGEASHSGPAVSVEDSVPSMDILRAALQEAHKPGSQMSCDHVPYSFCSSCIPSWFGTLSSSSSRFCFFLSPSSCSSRLVPGSQLQASRLLTWSLVLPCHKLPGSLSSLFSRMGFL